MTSFRLSDAAAGAILSSLAFLQSGGIAFASDPPPIQCEPTDRIDSSTSTDAEKKIKAAGYTQISDLKKGCDNFWHGRAFKNGMAIRVSLSPQGLVQPESD
jgi:hypothetical protein